MISSLTLGTLAVIRKPVISGKSQQLTERPKEFPGPAGPSRSCTSHVVGDCVGQYMRDRARAGVVQGSKGFLAAQDERSTDFSFICETKVRQGHRGARSCHVLF